MTAVILLVQLIATAIIWLLLIYVIMGWLLNFNVLNYYNPIVRQLWDALSAVADRLCGPIRRVLPDMGGLDLAPMIVFIIVLVVEQFLVHDILMPLAR